ncbi:ISLre2 family transposase, partial [Staphylococcus epidermidis]
MNSILQQIITEMMTSFGNSAFDLLTGKLDFANLVIETQKSFGKTLCQLLGVMLEQQDQVLADSSYRKQFFKIKDM